MRYRSEDRIEGGREHIVRFAREEARRGHNENDKDGDGEKGSEYKGMKVRE